MKTTFIENAILRLDKATSMILKCLDMLSDDEIWQRPNASSNSVANLILHLCGNITQYVIASMGHQQDLRERDLEFSAESGYSKEELQKKLLDTVNEVKEVLQNTTEEELLRKRHVQTYEMTGIGIVMHIVEHYSYHTGQIAFWTKLLKDKDLGFFKGVNLNAHNKS